MKINVFVADSFHIVPFKNRVELYYSLLYHTVFVPYFVFYLCMCVYTYSCISFLFVAARCQVLFGQLGPSSSVQLGPHLVFSICICIRMCICIAVVLYLLLPGGVGCWAAGFLPACARVPNLNQIAPHCSPTHLQFSILNFSSNIFSFSPIFSFLAGCNWVVIWAYIQPPPSPNSPSL